MDSIFRIKFRILIPLIVVVVIVLWITFSTGKAGKVKEHLTKFGNIQDIKLEERRGTDTVDKQSKFAKKAAELMKKEIDLVAREDSLARKTAKLQQKTVSGKKSDDLVIEKMIKPTTRSFQGNKLIHLDLKGAAPKMTYLKKLLPTLKQWGATGFLIEYEDMFPYDGELSVLKSPYAYKLTEVTDMLEEMKKHDFLVMPLIQTFGHFEFVLKHKKFAHLRYVGNMTNALSATNKGSIPLVKSMIEQMIKVHKPYMKYFHVGGDEVWILKEEENGKDIYVKHMTPVIDYVTSQKIIPVIWDDMMRTWSVDDLKMISSKGVEPMVWAYPADISQHFPQGMWERYTKVFKNIWIASAFKGADTPVTDFVPVQDRIQNHLSWLKLLSKLENSKMTISGIALTGWSRFDHDAALCELLPASLPSLALCLAVLNRGRLSNSTYYRVSKELGFQQPIILNPRRVPGKVTNADEGSFAGHSVYGVVLRLRKARNALYGVSSRIKGWFNDRQSATRDVFNVYHYQSCMHSLASAKWRLDEVKTLAKKSFPSVYADNTIDQWVWDKITSTQRQAEDMKRQLENFRKAIKVN